MDVASIHNSAELIAARTRAIRDESLRQSRHMREANFAGIETEDLRRLFQLYDEQFFSGWLARRVIEKTGRPVRFRLSTTMSRAGGKTFHWRRQQPDGTWQEEYEIAVGVRLLFNTFRPGDREVMVGGLVCTDRLEAMQRILEHEIIHLVELLTWGKSSCSAERFRTLARNIFGHVESCHQLVTPRERAAKEHNVRVGSRVEFEYEGRQRVGVVNRIHQRATVLVEAPDGMRYSDGKTYHKFYIPLAMLRVVGEGKRC